MVVGSVRCPTFDFLNGFIIPFSGRIWRNSYKTFASLLSSRLAQLFTIPYSCKLPIKNTYIFLEVWWGGGAKLSSPLLDFSTLQIDAKPAEKKIIRLADVYFKSVLSVPLAVAHTQSSHEYGNRLVSRLWGCLTSALPPPPCKPVTSSLTLLSTRNRPRNVMHSV